MSTKAVSPAVSMYIKALNDVWPSNQKMREYCLGKLDEVVTLENGMFFIIEKRKIDRDFCFGYSLSSHDSESYDAANDMVNHAMSNENYFIRQNMKHYDHLLENLRDSNYMPVLETHYRDSDDLKSLTFIRTAYVIEDQGGSACLEDIKGTISYRDGDKSRPYYIMNDQDIETAEAAILRCRERHEKKVRAYLKRYGLSKVNAWSYWRDA